MHLETGGKPHSADLSNGMARALVFRILNQTLAFGPSNAQLEVAKGGRYDNNKMESILSRCREGPF